MPENRVELPLISVIVPVYRAEKYIERCVKSLAAQTYKNIEFILVFDGDKESYVRCRNITGKDARFRLIMQEHGGVWKARNAGLEEVKGEFIGFVDSDDYIEPDMYEYLYRAAVKTGADVVQEGVRGYKTTLFSSCNKGRASAAGVISNSTCDKLYKREVCSGIFFKDFETGQDLYFNMEIAGRTNKVCFARKNKYHYFSNPEGISKTTRTGVRIRVARRMCRAAADQFGRNSDIYKRILAEMLLNYLDSSSRIIRGYEEAGEGIRRHIVKAIRSNIFFIMIYQGFTFKHRVKFLAAAIGFRLYSAGIGAMENLNVYQA